MIFKNLKTRDMENKLEDLKKTKDQLIKARNLYAEKIKAYENENFELTNLNTKLRKRLKELNQAEGKPKSAPFFTCEVTEDSKESDSTLDLKPKNSIKKFEDFFDADWASSQFSKTTRSSISSHECDDEVQKIVMHTRVPSLKTFQKPTVRAAVPFKYHIFYLIL